MTDHAIERWVERINPHATDRGMIAQQIEDYARECEIVLETDRERYLRHRELQLFFPCGKKGGKFIITSTLTWQMVEQDGGYWKINPNRL